MMYHRRPENSYEEGDPAVGGTKAATMTNAHARLGGVNTDVSNTENPFSWRKGQVLLGLYGKIELTCTELPQLDHPKGRTQHSQSIPSLLSTGDTTDHLQPENRS